MLAAAAEEEGEAVLMDERIVGASLPPPVLSSDRDSPDEVRLLELALAARLTMLLLDAPLTPRDAGSVGDGAPELLVLTFDADAASPCSCRECSAGEASAEEVVELAAGLGELREDAEGSSGGWRLCSAAPTPPGKPVRD